jgi:hypothetical protein
MISSNIFIEDSLKPSLLLSKASSIPRNQSVQVKDAFLDTMLDRSWTTDSMYAVEASQS